MELRQQRSHHSVLQKYRIANRLQKLASIASTHRRPERISYLALPAQIRNKIIRYVLLPGDIHIRAAKEHGVKAKAQRIWDVLQQIQNGDDHRKFTRPPSLPGFQILATCKSIYGLYHERFYALNTFFLPPGPLDETLKHFFKHVQPEHVNMIGRIGIRLGLEDLTPAGLKDVEDFMSQVRRCSPLSGDRRVGQEWADTVHLHLLHIGYEKLAFLRKMRGLKMVKMVAVTVAEGEGEEVFEIDGLDLERALEVTDGSYDEMQFRAEEVSALVRVAGVFVKKEVEEKVDKDGWGALKAWVNRGGGFRSRV